METESRKVGVGFGRGEMGSSHPVGLEAQFYGVRGVLEKDGNEDCTTTRMYLTPLDCALGNG